MSIKSVLLTSADIELLARLPIVSGSCPRLNTPEELHTFQRLVALDLVVGAPGCYSVRWGVLSERQYAAVSQLRAGMTEYERMFGKGGPK